MKYSESCSLENYVNIIIKPRDHSLHSKSIMEFVLENILKVTELRTLLISPTTNYNIISLDGLKIENFFNLNWFQVYQRTKPNLYYSSFFNPRIPLNHQ